MMGYRPMWDVGPPDSYYDPPEPNLTTCPCGEEVEPGTNCPSCNEPCPTDEEMRDANLERQAEEISGYGLLDDDPPDDWEP